jgi:outer membrane protein assembly factor BamB
MSATSRFVAVLLTMICSVVRADDWPQWLGPNRSGFVSDESQNPIQLPERGLNPVWKTSEPLRGGWGSPIVVGDRVFLFTYRSRSREGMKLPEPKYPELTADEKKEMTADDVAKYEADRSRESADRTRASTVFEDHVLCFDLKTGEQIWDVHWEGRLVQWGQSSTPTAHMDRLLVVGSDREVHAIAQSDGKPIWTSQFQTPVELREPISSSVAIAGDLAIVLADRLRAIKLETGETAWEKPPETCGGMHSSPAIWQSQDGPVAIVNLAGGKTVGVQAKSGEELWRLDTLAERSSPVVAGDRLVTFGGSRKGGVRCYELGETPNELWKYQRLADPGSSPSVSNNRVVVAGDKVVVCLDLETGKSLWTEQLDLAQSQYSSPLTIGQTALFADQGLWFFDLSDSSPRPAIEARFDANGLMASPDQHRGKLDLEKLEPAEREEIWKSKIVDRGAVECTSPAIANGHLIVRLKTGLACYRLGHPSSAVAESDE